jgi:hypothetical protein
VPVVGVAGGGPAWGASDRLRGGPWDTARLPWAGRLVAGPGAGAWPLLGLDPGPAWVLDSLPSLCATAACTACMHAAARARHCAPTVWSLQGWGSGQCVCVSVGWGGGDSVHTLHVRGAVRVTGHKERDGFLLHLPHAGTRNTQVQYAAQRQFEQAVQTHQSPPSIACKTSSSLTAGAEPPSPRAAVGVPVKAPPSPSNTGTPSACKNAGPGSETRTTSITCRT